MAQQTINVGTAPNDGTGTPLRTAFQYTNSNFSELYTAVGPSGNNIVVPGNATITGDLTAGGNVGFGTTNLTSISGYNTLKINNATNGAIIDLAQGDSYKGRIVGSTAGLQLETSGSLPILLATGGTLQYRIDTSGIFTWYDGAGGSRMILNSSGLGINRSPSVKLDIQGTTSDSTAYSVFIRNSSAQAIFASRNDGRFVFGNGTTDNVFIESNGNLGVGASPDERLTVAGNIKLNGNRTVIFQQTAGVAAGTVSFRNSSGVQKGAIGSYVNVADEGAVEIIGPTGVSNAVFRSSGNLDLNTGNLVMAVSGKGIDFSATANSSGTMTSELLNDYEEGTWTPSITFGGASVGMTGTFAGRYTKVGRAVTVNAIMAFSAKGSSTGIAKIAGLPFTSANAAGEYTAISIRLDRVSFADYPCGYVGPNVSVVELENTTNAGTISSLTDANFTDSSVVVVNFTYTV